MRSLATLLAAILVMGSVALAQPNRRPVASRRGDASVPADAASDAAASADGAADAGVSDAATSPTCCCRAWSHGWQYAWRAEGECAAQNGSCVSPDHC
jgi:hypothetical protein